MLSRDESSPSLLMESSPAEKPASTATAKQYNFEIFSLFKITVFYLNIF